MFAPGESNTGESNILGSKNQARLISYFLLNHGLKQRLHACIHDGDILPIHAKQYKKSSMQKLPNRGKIP